MFNSGYTRNPCRVWTAVSSWAAATWVVMTWIQKGWETRMGSDGISVRWDRLAAEIADRDVCFKRMVKPRHPGKMLRRSLLKSLSRNRGIKGSSMRGIMAKSWSFCRLGPFSNIGFAYSGLSGTVHSPWQKDLEKRGGPWLIHVSGIESSCIMLKRCHVLIRGAYFCTCM